MNFPCLNCQHIIEIPPSILEYNNFIVNCDFCNLKIKGCEHKGEIKLFLWEKFFGEHSLIGLINVDKIYLKGKNSDKIIAEFSYSPPNELNDEKLKKLICLL